MELLGYDFFKTFINAIQCFVANTRSARHHPQYGYDLTTTGKKTGL